MIQLRRAHGSAPPGAGSRGWEHRVLADATELAETVMESASLPPGYVRREIPVGGRPAHVYTRRPEPGKELAPAIVVVIPADSAPRPSRAELRRRFGLTPREAEVALMLAARRSNKEIASQLSIANKTAWRHTESVMSKLNTRSRRDVRNVLETMGRG